MFRKGLGLSLLRKTPLGHLSWGQLCPLCQLCQTLSIQILFPWDGSKGHWAPQDPWRHIPAPSRAGMPEGHLRAPSPHQRGDPSGMGHWISSHGPAEPWAGDGSKGGGRLSFIFTWGLFLPGAFQAGKEPLPAGPTTASLELSRERCKRLCVSPARPRCATPGWNPPERGATVP